MELTLVIMAAGMGSRYGGVKQLDPVGPRGELLLEYAVHDAKAAGFTKVVFILREELLSVFKAHSGDRIAQYMDVRYAVQRLNDLPDGFSLPEGRTKPWGTGHALRAARAVIDGPCCVINADDFYGREAYQAMADFLRAQGEDTVPWPCALGGYAIENTLSDNGTVSRGVCTVDETGKLVTVTERLKLALDGDGVTDADSGACVALGTPVSLNLWGFPREVIPALDEAFIEFLTQNPDPIKGEFFLPFFVNDLLCAGKLSVAVLPVSCKWYGVTYPQDRLYLVESIDKMVSDGIYPAGLFGRDGE